MTPGKDDNEVWHKAGRKDIKWFYLDNSIMQTFLTAMQMAEQGDKVSELTDAASPCCMRGEVEG